MTDTQISKLSHKIIKVISILVIVYFFITHVLVNCIFMPPIPPRSFIYFFYIYRFIHNVRKKVRLKISFKAKTWGKNEETTWCEEKNVDCELRGRKNKLITWIEKLPRRMHFSFLSSNRTCGRIISFIYNYFLKFHTSQYKLKLNQKTYKWITLIKLTRSVIS